MWADGWALLVPTKVWITRAIADLRAYIHGTVSHGGSPPIAKCDVCRSRGISLATLNRPAAKFALVDLFAGCGGLTQGFVDARRFEPVAAVEADLHAAATYAVNFGNHVFAGDISDWLDDNLPAADLVVGGPPCQGFSNLGSRRARDPRNALWRRYVDAVARIKPRYFVIENVPLFLRSGQFDALRAETRRTRKLADYSIDAWLLDAADYGAPQKRLRAIIIGTRDGSPMPGPPPRSRTRRKTVRDAIADLDPLVFDTELPRRQLVFDGREVPGPFKSNEIHLTRNFTALSRERFRCIPPGGNRFDLPDELKAECWRRHTRGATDVMGRLKWDEPSVTIRTEFFKPEKGRYLHPIEDRPITPLEAARLQGFPDDFVWCGNKQTIARQIGNAVPIPLARAIGRHIARLMTT